MQTTTGNGMIVWALLAIALAVNIAGYVWNLYQQFWWFDEVLHGYTIFAITLALGVWLYGTVFTGYHSHALLLVLAIASTGIAIGALWEIAEWAYDQMVQGNVILGKRDTIIDLVVDSIGALAAGALCLPMVADRPRQDHA
jgi:hypothetical protein